MNEKEITFEEFNKWFDGEEENEKLNEALKRMLDDIREE